MPKIKFKIVTPEKVVYENEIDQITLPTQSGEITVLPHHIPLLSALKAGELVVKTGNREISLVIAGGFAEIRKNEVIVLTENAERAEEIDEPRAEEARKRAQNLLAQAKNKEAVDYTGLAAKMEKELARLKVVRKRKHGVSPTIKTEE
ncbi:MAG: ATP synthase F1 subunit epsilon [Candidatus Buchananbacteria bacterium RIFCSPHIGHO2_01_FULL_46_12]|uniref:ATP synthase epsilon chain n=3 Tax=Candidatus Buchananiibacteriota TaxID=1817903 RepID=A0A1G1Y9N3_9BACT|nr:MAG: ATP synthase F1 subunit epsilon [Candidatus Buchananbacteria bacterium RIFCSPHIGHO2_01_FULL_46_12]OGY55842.1 MAG: ATP synthase F1 subunit epsilon [Candidatus Buchananbacteria bacterium RIFCSPLOWO2_02_FULL_46_11b]